VDRYATHAVLQLLTAAADRWRDALADAVAALADVRVVVERSDADGRHREGLAERTGTLRGPDPSGMVDVWEAAPADRDRWVFAVDVLHGHKTGFYLDQRVSRRVVAELARDARVLNVFAYTGGFSVAAWWGGARSVLSVDSSGPALSLAAENLGRNGLPDGGLVQDDAFAYLRQLRDRGEQFDLVVLDPPKLAASDAQVPKASRAYKDLNLLAFKLLAPGGHLVTFSCSGAVSEDLFQKIVFGAALDAKRNVQVVQRLGQPSDHPVLLTFPEAAYLKGFVCRVTD
jgi:23S rRNA (cytosine1962-C5)-methyltransferase